MHDHTDDLEAGLTPPPPPPPPPAPVRQRRNVIGRRGAAVAVASGLVVGGVAGGYVISQAASPTPSASASPSAGSTAPWSPHGGPAGLATPASRTQDLQQVATAIGITATQLQTEMTAGKTIAAIAAEHNVSAATVISTLATDENTEIDAAVSAGTLTSAQATQLKAQTTQRVTGFVNGTEPPHGFGGRGGPGGLQSEDQQVVATAIGITTTQLQTELSAGKTIAAIASEHNVSTATVVSALAASENSEIDKRVASGEITAAQAAQAKTQTTQRVTDEVNGTHPAGGFGGPRGGPEGFPANAPAGAPSTN